MELIARGKWSKTNKQWNMVVALRHPIPVVIGYATAVARLDGTIAFYEDLYGHDAALERALVGGPSLAAARSDARSDASAAAP